MDKEQKRIYKKMDKKQLRYLLTKYENLTSSINAILDDPISEDLKVVKDIKKDMKEIKDYVKVIRKIDGNN